MIVLYWTIFIAIVGLGVGVMLWADYRQAMGFRHITRQIEITNDSVTPERRDCIVRLMAAVVYAGPFTVIEVRRLRKCLSGIPKSIEIGAGRDLGHLG